MHEGVPSAAGKAAESFHFKLGTERHFSRAAKCPLLATEMFERRLSALRSGSSRGMIVEVGAPRKQWHLALRALGGSAFPAAPFWLLPH